MTQRPRTIARAIEVIRLFERDTGCSQLDRFAGGTVRAESTAPISHARRRSLGI